MPEVQVVLPRWQDVRRQRQKTAHGGRVPLVRGSANARQTSCQDPIVIKPEPEDNVKPLPALAEHDRAEARNVLRTAVQNLRNVCGRV